MMRWLRRLFRRPPTVADCIRAALEGQVLVDEPRVRMAMVPNGETW